MNRQIRSAPLSAESVSTFLDTARIHLHSAERQKDVLSVLLSMLGQNNKVYAPLFRSCGGVQYTLTLLELHRGSVDVVSLALNVLKECYEVSPPQSEEAIVLARSLVRFLCKCPYDHNLLLRTLHHLSRLICVSNAATLEAILSVGVIDAVAFGLRWCDGGQTIHSALACYETLLSKGDLYADLVFGVDSRYSGVLLKTLDAALGYHSSWPSAVTTACVLLQSFAHSPAGARRIVDLGFVGKLLALFNDGSFKGVHERDLSAAIVGISKTLEALFSACPSAIKVALAADGLKLALWVVKLQPKRETATTAAMAMTYRLMTHRAARMQLTATANDVVRLLSLVAVTYPHMAVRDVMAHFTRMLEVVVRLCPAEVAAFLAANGLLENVVRPLRLLRDNMARGSMTFDENEWSPLPDPSAVLALLGCVETP